MYIIIEGIDTCGKSTQISLLREALPEAIFTKEPGGTTIGMKLREILLGDYEIDKRAEFLLFLADRAEHRAEIIEPNKKNGKTIISDRGLVSGLSYSEGVFDEDFVVKATMFAMDCVLPDLVILLELDETELSNRLDAKMHDRIEKQGIEYLLRVQSNMEKYTQKLGIKLLKISAKTDKNEICKIIVEKIKEKSC